jgi:potassium efflux system protein
MIGIPWSKVQWLAAAITVGIGFGLQEIFANFVSGLIILFQRPIRLGDVITVGDVTGTVSQIQIRATTIKDWDNKSLLVPNKEFITGRVINWTLSDSVIRLVLPVSVAYGSDIQLAHHLLLKVAQENAQVLKDPVPSVFFKGFGESRLNFDLRVYIPSIDYWVNVQNDLNLAIDRVLRSAEIKLAIPQQDVHVRTFPENVQLENLDTANGRLSA